MVLCLWKRAFSVSNGSYDDPTWMPKFRACTPSSTDPVVMVTGTETADRPLRVRSGNSADSHQAHTLPMKPLVRTVHVITTNHRVLVRKSTWAMVRQWWGTGVWADRQAPCQQFGQQVFAPKQGQLRQRVCQEVGVWQHAAHLAPWWQPHTEVTVLAPVTCICTWP